MALMLAPEVAAFLAAARVAHLATADRAGQPLVLPVCFAVQGHRLFMSLDEKPKRRAPRELKRVRNILENPRVAVVADRWDEDWRRLAWVHLSGTARVLEPPLPAAPSADREAVDREAAEADAALHRFAVLLLREKYAPYRGMDLDGRPALAMEIERVATWGLLT